LQEKGFKSGTGIADFFDGGYFMPPDNGDYSNILDIANSTDSEVWFPLYPLAL